MLRSLGEFLHAGSRPSLADVLLAAVVARLLVLGKGWSALLRDGDTGWHIRTGEWILQHRAVPTTDLFSFSRSGQQWFAWEWLSDVVMALVHQRWGLAGVSVLACIVIVLAAMVLFRHMLWRGANVVVAFAVLMVAVGAASVHYLARPHVFTILLMAVSLWLVECDRRRPRWTVWLLAPLSVVWINLHGGFFALPASLVVLAAGYGVEGWLDAEQRAAKWTAGRRYVAVAAATLAASVINPYGIALHRHVGRYLASDWIRNRISEFQSPSFRSEDMLQFEILLFVSLALIGVLLANKRVADALLVLVWAHFALSSARHIPLFVVVTAPLAAAEISRLWGDWVSRRSPRSVVGTARCWGADMGPSFRRSSVWGPIFAIGVMLATPSNRWPTDFPEESFPVSLVRSESSRLTAARVYTSDQWGDYLIYKGWPKQRVFFDGRSDFYGPALGDEYLILMGGRRGWANLLDKYRINMALVPCNGPLVSLLDMHPAWKRVREDKVGVLYERRDNRVSSAANPR
ncbi:MAG: hypothetical protein M1541_11210 [Acidobacteria bacterium]|nr:hypothetical protein [Acidobacteriota bacterium]